MRNNMIALFFFDIFVLLFSLVSGAQQYSTWMADSVIARGTPLGKDTSGNILVTYEHAVFERALEMVYNKTGNITYYNYLKTGIDNVVGSTGTILDYDLEYYTLDDVRLGPEFIYLYVTRFERSFFLRIRIYALLQNDYY